MSNTPFREGSVYPVVFMVLVSIVFVGVLAAAYRLSEATINANEERSYHLQVFSVFRDEFVDADTFNDIVAPENIKASYEKYFKELPLDLPDRKAYEFVVDGIKKGYYFDIAGNGLWGSMRAIIAISPDMSTIMGFSVYKQMETPGLGARIEEEAFKSQFKGKPLMVEGKLREFTLIPEDQAPDTDIQIKQITGATITTKSVINMIYSEMNLIVTSLGGQHESE